MYNDNWVAQVVYVPGRITNAIYLSRLRDVGTREYLKGDDTIITVKGNEVSDKDLAFTYLDDDQLRALVEAFDRHGVKRPDAGFVEGKLEATERHLEDLHRLVFEPGVIKMVKGGKV